MSRSSTPASRAMARAWSLVGGSTFTAARDGRFTGGYITRHYGSPSDNVNALQLEVAQSAYMDEAKPQAWDETRARRLTSLIDRLIPALTEWAQARVSQ